MTTTVSGCSEECVSLLDSLDPSCSALKKVGGVNRRVYIGQLSQLSSYGQDTTTKDITAITLGSCGSTSYKLKKFSGKKYKNNGTYELTVGENVNVVMQSAILVLYHFTSRDKEKIEQLFNAEDLFVIFENNAGQVEVWGIEFGLNASAGSGGTGVLLNDPTAFTITLSGEQSTLSRIFNVGPTSTLAQNLAYLDAIAN